MDFYGDGPNKPAMEALVKDLSCKVNFKGREEDICKIYESLDLIVVPSLKPEAFSLVIVEAWQTQTVVLASDSGAHRELIDQDVNGFLFKSGDINDLLKMLRYIKEKRYGFKEIKQRAFKKAISMTVDNYLTMFLKVLGE